MVSPTNTSTWTELVPLPVLLDDIPILYEDEEEGEMGESELHAYLEHILRYGLKAHLASAPRHCVFTNMNLYYREGPPHPTTGSLPYVSPDLMVVVPYRPLGERVPSYRIDTDGPAPLLTSEVLSERTAQQGDLGRKLRVYAMLGIPEYVLVDGTGRWLPERLLLKRLLPDRTWLNEQDADGGVTSQLGFRLLWDSDGFLRVLNAATGRPYARPDEADQEAQARRLAEERIQQLEAELARLKSALPPLQD